MTTSLVSKVQFINYETGEFSGTESRTIDELVDLIASFPWAGQRQGLHVALTNPSVTIERHGDEFLKFAVYYKGSFVLYYLNVKQELYTKSVLLPEQAYPYIRAFYANEAFDVNDFKKQRGQGKRYLKHFVTQRFEYVVTHSRAVKYLLSTSGVSLGFSMFMLIILAIGSLPGFWLYLFMSGAMFFVGGGLNLLIFFNYY